MHREQALPASLVSPDNADSVAATYVVAALATNANSYGAIEVAAEPALPAPRDATPDEPIEVMAHPVGVEAGPFVGTIAVTAHQTSVADSHRRGFPMLLHVCPAPQPPSLGP